MFRTDKGFIFPNIDDCIRLKELLSLSNKYDDMMIKYEWVADVKEIIKKLELTKINILPKNRYIYIKANRSLKKQIINNFKYKSLPYPKGQNTNYDTSYKTTTKTEK